MADITLKKPTQGKRKNNKLGNTSTASTSDLMTVGEGEKHKDLNFKVDPAFHKAFKRFAINNDMTMRELLETSFAHYRDIAK